MKHTLKSLLITSVLTLPTVLGSGTPGSDALDNQDPRNTASNTPVDNENHRNAASEVQTPPLDKEAIANLINGNEKIPEDQKNVILNGISQNATGWHILNAADGLREIGEPVSRR